MMRKATCIGPADRAAALSDWRERKMARSAHAFIRGTAERFYAWLASDAAPSLPAAPTLWICGDCHVGNIGLVADDNGQTRVAIRDLDQATRSHPAYDLCRLGLSLAVLARSSDLPGLATCELIEHLVNGYLAAFPHSNASPPPLPSLLSFELRKAKRRRWGQLTRLRTNGDAATLPLGDTFWPLTALERHKLDVLLSQAAIAQIASPAERGDVHAPVDVLDAAYWRKGCSSLGQLRYATLLDVGGEARAGADLCLLDIKEAVPSFAPALELVPRDHARRVQEAATYLTPALGSRIVTAAIGNRPVFVRKVLPQDTKVDVRRLTLRRSRRLAAYLGYVVGEAHARQLLPDERRTWCRTLQQARTKTLSAPSWLWQSTTMQLALLESQYLDHCRRYLGKGGQTTASPAP